MSENLVMVEELTFNLCGVGEKWESGRCEIL